MITTADIIEEIVKDYPGLTMAQATSNIYVDYHFNDKKWPQIICLLRLSQKTKIAHIYARPPTIIEHEISLHHPNSIAQIQKIITDIIYIVECEVKSGDYRGSDLHWEVPKRYPRGTQLADEAAQLSHNRPISPNKY